MGGDGTKIALSNESPYPSPDPYKPAFAPAYVPPKKTMLSRRLDHIFSSDLALGDILLSLRYGRRTHRTCAYFISFISHGYVYSSIHAACNHLDYHSCRPMSSGEA
ncbi:hypothetical protein K503DRAFT_777568 [Rhizopogon vinicolor AM-OR11-026]|uniref:Uncharacterized protein n=1 Tax=Rhizopogon vinicolor AM-OR11-026 TaxID=1314800 RepID=A0A1B7MFS1_9AGAM|nr:hypothetical protein K503DRAFT_777568 [Rhizopogon vinicolor AM-OR11-026]